MPTVVFRMVHGWLHKVVILLLGPLLSNVAIQIQWGKKYKVARRLGIEAGSVGLKPNTLSSTSYCFSLRLHLWGYLGCEDSDLLLLHS